jgi:predicted  nucleic acid-binding Zn-ribbon protein
MSDRVAERMANDLRAAKNRLAYTRERIANLEHKIAQIKTEFPHIQSHIDWLECCAKHYAEFGNEQLAYNYADEKHPQP